MSLHRTDKMILPALVVLSGLAAADLVLFPYSNGNGSFGNPVDVPFVPFPSTLPPACATALNSTIACDPAVQYLSAGGNYGVQNSSEVVCTTACGQSLASYHANVVSACAGATLTSGLPNTFRGDLLWSFYNVSCATDPTTADNCLESLQAFQNSYTGNITQFTDYPTSFLCSPCQISFWRSLQASPYSGYDSTRAELWASIQQICNVTYPTEPTPSGYNLTSTGTNATAPANVTCASGQAYTVQAGDTCQSIGLAHSVSQGTLRILNGIPPASCSSLVTGQTLCLPKTCQTYVWQTNDTCASIAYAHGISTTTLIAYNPAINPACSNTDLTNGTVICLSPAFGTYTPTTIAGVTPTGSATYANSTASAPGAVASGTTLECGKWYKANSGDTCSVISVAYNIAVSLFKLINPSIDSGCDNITPGLYYCVQPVAGWNTTASNTTTAAVVTPPGPTPTGTTSQCYEWYVVQPNDTCSIIEASFGITFAQIVQWNPSIDSNCYNLMLNESYCVSGPSNTTSVTATTTLAGSTVASTVSSTTTTVSSPSTSSSTGSATVSPPAPTPSGTTSQCYEWYVVQSADSCNKIETTYSISFAQLQAWNPSLDSACSNLIAGEAYCVAGATTATTATTTATASPTAGACLQTYTVVGGDTCYTIDQQFGITQAQLTSWNSLDANCDIYAGQVLCVKE